MAPKIAAISPASHQESESTKRRANQPKTAPAMPMTTVVGMSVFSFIVRVAMKPAAAPMISKMMMPGIGASPLILSYGDGIRVFHP